jgi:hypothetical protein
MEYLWRKAEEDSMSKEEVQGAIDQLASWIRDVERLSPGGLFDMLK